MPILYKSETMNWSSNPENGKPHGYRNVVEIRNGKGVKVKEVLGDCGQVTQHHTHPLKEDELHNITKGNFVPGLWFGIEHAPKQKTHTKTRTHKQTSKKEKGTRKVNKK